MVRSFLPQTCPQLFDLVVHPLQRGGRPVGGFFPAGQFALLLLQFACPTFPFRLVTSPSERGARSFTGETLLELADPRLDRVDTVQLRLEPLRVGRTLLLLRLQFAAEL